MGDNNNPTAEQFKASFRQILINNEIKSSEGANCRDALQILQIPSTHISSIPNEVECQIEAIEPFTPNDYLLDMYQDASIIKVSAEIDHKIQNQFFQCALCANVLAENDAVDGSSNISVDYRPPCISTTHICKVARKYFELFTTQPHFIYSNLFETILIQLVYCRSDFSQHKEHKQFLVEFTVEEFIRSAANELARQLTMRGQNQMLRSKLTKTIQFLGQ